MKNNGYLLEVSTMKKIICDICGTSYQESAECCPICGCTRDEAMLLGEEFTMDERPSRGNGRGGQFASKKKAIFDFDEVNAEEEDDLIQEVRCDEEDRPGPKPRHNTFVIIVLTVLIAVLLLLAGFLFLRYLLPAKEPQETVASTAAETVAVTEAPQVIAVPCESLALTSGTAKLSTEGAFFLINVSVYPENTTDQLIYHSADSSIATVDESGRITAVSEGTTVVYITCGTKQIPCEVVCDFTPETVPATEETLAEETQAPAETVEETVAETEPEEPGLKDVELKLEKTDIILDIGYYFTLKLDCDLEPEEVEWSVDPSYVAKVDEKGVVTAIGKGVADVIVKYGDQTVVCKVRCKSSK